MSPHIDRIISQDDISPDKADHLLKLHQDIMAIVVLVQDHQLVLDKLCLAAEQMIPDALASIMLFDETQTHLGVKAAPSIPEAAQKALNGLAPGTSTGSCANAVFHNEAQFVCNTLEDPRWENVRQFARDFSIGACWAMPIRTTGNLAVGSFALSSFEERAPTTFQIRLLETSAHLAGIILKRQLEEKQLWEMAHYDPLTQIPNRILLNMRLEHAISKANRQNIKLAVLFLDLDNFKDINDTYGHKAGDQVLLSVADRITHCLRTEDTLARMGGDEFMILLEDIHTPYHIRHVAEKILAAFAKPISINRKDHLVTASIGISIFPEDGNDAQLLQQNADTAMYAAKKRGRNCFAYYEKVLSQEVEDRLSLSNDMRSSLVQNDFLLHYQPLFETLTGKLSGAEALIRWQHQQRGLIGPDHFISLAEESNFINILGDWVIKTACEQCQAWLEAGYPEFTLAINLSVKQLVNDYANQLFNMISETNFPIENLEIEITESLLMNNSEIALIELHKIRALGISICLDDFGTGHSSLAQLKHLPISKLKIDRSFVHDIVDDENDRVIAHSIIAMGQSMNLGIIAEGVETEQQKSFLVDEGCDYLQGNLLSHPLPVEEFEKLLKATIDN